MSLKETILSDIQAAEGDLSVALEAIRDNLNEDFGFQGVLVIDQRDEGDDAYIGFLARLNKHCPEDGIAESGVLYGAILPDPLRDTDGFIEAVENVLEGRAAITAYAFVFESEEGIVGRRVTFL